MVVVKRGTMNGKFVSYIRVSTQKQGKSGLGLEAQREAVTTYLNGGKWELISELVEVESGKHSDRPQLKKALALCRMHKATLVVAKLDRLARNVAFISALMESGVKFVAVDCPDANELTLHILASVAQYEAKAISDRTKAALAAAKARGVKLGNDNLTRSISRKGAQASLEARQALALKRKRDIMPYVSEFKERGITSYNAIALALNEENVPAPRGGHWSAVQVSRILQ